MTTSRLAAVRCALHRALARELAPAMHGLGTSSVQAKEAQTVNRSEAVSLGDLFAMLALVGGALLLAAAVGVILLTLVRLT